jgi:DNA-binding transcriptional LysR family regulator
MASLRQLEYLVAVVDEGSFTRAAEALHVTQPALSHQVRTLEREAGGPLLERLPRSVRLTSAGRSMLPHARAAIGEAERAISAARRTNGVQHGELQIATVYSISLGVLPGVLHDWHLSHPHIRTRLFEHRHAHDLRAAMVAAQADLAVGPEPANWCGPVHLLGHEEFVVVVAATDEAAANDAVTVDLRTLARRNWVCYTPEHGLSTLFEQVCATAGFLPSPAIHTGQTAAAPLLAAAGLGPALVPANIIPPHFPGRILRPEPPVRRMIAAYSRGPLEPLATAFVQALIQHAPLVPAHVRRQLRLADD